MIFELREYDIHPGMMANWLKLMQEDIHPFQTQKGVAFIASFVAVDNPNKYIWIRRYNSQNERERITHEIYESAHWKENIKPKINEMLVKDSVKVTALKATDISPIH